jgi:hypothetical protein
LTETIWGPTSPHGKRAIVNPIHKLCQFLEGNA